MRILVTGASGFVGTWLQADLAAAGHDAVPAPGIADLDITDRDAVATLVREVRPDAVAHLAGVAFGPDASRDPGYADAVNVGGTRAVTDALLAHAPAAMLLVTGSSEVYGRPDPIDLPLTEAAATHPEGPYGRSKLDAERVGLAAADGGLHVVVTRAFNHTGPGQRPEFVAPALARRVLAARAAGTHDVVVGNLTVRRDIGDVRDVVRAYRLLLEGLASGVVPSGTVVNVATGRAVAIGQLLEELGHAADWAVRPVTDPALVRPNEAPEIRGDATLLRHLTGWAPTIPLERTLADLVVSLGDGDGVKAPSGSSPAMGSNQ